jgi:tetratricopeptide (TPR) repeat protein
VACNQYTTLIQIEKRSSTRKSRFKRTEFPTLLDVARSLVHVQQALELAPNSAIITYSLVTHTHKPIGVLRSSINYHTTRKAGSYAIGRQLEPAIELYERAYRLDPNLEIAMVCAVVLATIELSKMHFLTFSDRWKRII